VGTPPGPRIGSSQTGGGATFSSVQFSSVQGQHSVQFSSVQFRGNIQSENPTILTQKYFLGLKTKLGAVGKHHARWKDPVSNNSIYFCQILTAARLPGSDSTKLVQNHPIFMHFGTISGLQSGLGRGETGGLGFWRRPWTRTLFSKCCVRTSRPQDVRKIA